MDDASSILANDSTVKQAIVNQTINVVKIKAPRRDAASLFEFRCFCDSLLFLNKVRIIHAYRINKNRKTQVVGIMYKIPNIKGRE